jgi:hypothetical protein
MWAPNAKMFHRKKTRNLSMAGFNPIHEELEETGVTITIVSTLVLFIMVMIDISSGDTARLSSWLYGSPQ